MRQLKKQATRFLLIIVALFFIIFFVLAYFLEEKAGFILFPLIIVMNIYGSKYLRDIKCPKCQQSYGIRSSQYTWLIVPEVCQSCGQYSDC